MAKSKRYFVINPAGAIHEVTKKHAEWRLSTDPRYRMATPKEIEAYFEYVEKQAQRKKNGVGSVAFEPVAPRWSPSAETGVDVDALMEAAAKKAEKGKAKPAEVSEK